MPVIHGKPQRFLCLLSSVVELLCFSGYSFGFNAFVQVYKEAGVFSYLCFNSPNVSSSVVSSNNSTMATALLNCAQQDAKFLYAFTLWTIMPGICQLLIGFLLQKIEFRATKLIGIGSFLTSTIFYAFTTAETPHLVFAAGCFGVFAFMCFILVNIQVARLYPRYSGMITSICSGAGDSSPIIFTLLAILVQNEVGSYTQVLLIYGIFGTVMLLLSTLFLFPANEKGWQNLTLLADSRNLESYKFEIMDSEKQDDEISSETPEVEGRLELEGKHTKLKTKASQNMAERQLFLQEVYPCLRDSLKSTYCILLVISFSILSLRHSYYLSSLGMNMHRKFGGEAPQILSYFNYFLLCGIFILPVIGGSIDLSRNLFKRWDDPYAIYFTHGISVWYNKRMRPYALINILTICLAIIVTLLDFSTSRIVVYFGFFLFTIFRGYLYSSHYATIIQAFPAPHFGIVAGVASFSASVIMVLQFFLDYLQKLYGGLAVQIILLVLLIGIFGRPLHLFFQK